MEFFLDQELNQQLINAVESADFDTAKTLLSENQEGLSSEAHKFLCQSYQTSPHQENWLQFWELILTLQNPNPPNLISRTILLSQDKNFYPFLFIILKFPQYSQIVEDYAIRVYLKKFSQKIPSLFQFIQDMDNLNPEMQSIFYSGLIKQSFKYGRFLILESIQTLKGPLFIAQFLETFPPETLKTLSRKAVEHHFNPEFIFNLMQLIPSLETKKLFYKNLIMTSIEQNNTAMLRFLFEKKTSTYFFEIIHELTESEKKLICFQLVTNLNTDTEFLLQVIQELDSKEFFQAFVMESYTRYNIPLLQSLRRLCPPFDFEEASKSLNPIKLAIFLQKDASDAAFIYSKMNAFIQGYGHIDYEDALLTLAQRRERKAYDFSPILLRSTELEEFVNVLKSAPTPLKLSFVISGIHFISGEISIDKDGMAKIFIIDSLGSDIWYENFVTDFAKAFPSHEIYTSREKRQHATNCCAVFALDDVAHLATLRIEGHADIWEYLLANRQDIDTTTDCYSVPLPLSLTRTMQSTTLTTTLLPQRTQSSQAFVINKKGQTTEESVTPFFKRESPTDKKPRNTRLSYKMSKMIEQNWNYLNSHPQETIQTDMQYFSLNAWRQRMLGKPEPSYLEELVAPDFTDEAIAQELMIALQGLKDKFTQNEDTNMLGKAIQEIIEEYAPKLPQNDLWQDFLVKVINDTLAVMISKQASQKQNQHRFYSPLQDAEIDIEALEAMKARLQGNILRIKAN
jgi:hypothetical protein